MTGVPPVKIPAPRNAVFFIQTALVKVSGCVVKITKPPKKNSPDKEDISIMYPDFME